jgi:DNA-binding transcriptional regulator YiaG
MTEKDLLNQLEEIRIKENISIDDFYPALGISKSTFHLWKRGAVPKSIEVFLKLYELLNN